jgi:hypothetical protein
MDWIQNEQEKNEYHIKKKKKGLTLKIKRKEKN